MNKLLILIACIAPTLLLGQSAFFNHFGRETFGNYRSADIRSIRKIDNGYSLVGYVYTSSQRNGFVMNINNNGEIKNSKIDSTYNDMIYLSSTNDAEFVYYAGFKSDTLFSNQTKFLRKSTQSGQVLWDKEFGDTSHFYGDNYIQNAFHSNGNIAIIGTNFSGDHSTDADFTLISSGGTVLVHRLFQNQLGAYENDLPISSAKISDGYLVLVKSEDASGTAHNIFKLDEFGNELWRKDVTNTSFPEFDIPGKVNTPYCLTSLSNGNYIVAICVEEYIGAESQRTLLAEYDENGNFLFVKSFFEGIDVDPKKLELNENNEVFLTGNISCGDNCFFDVMAAKFDSELNLIWLNHFGYDQNEFYNVSTATSDGGILVCGRFFRWLQPSGYDFYVVKTDCMGNVEWSNQSCIPPSSEEIIVLGNPVVNDLLIHLPQSSSDEQLTFKLINSIGQEVLNQNFQGNIINTNLTYLSRGIYIYIIQTSSGKNFRGKIEKI